jgi:hypothetical protein
MRFAACLLLVTTSVSAADPLRIEKGDGRLTIHHRDTPLAVYVYQDAEILRPYFTDVHSLTGRRITRTHPPKEPEATDHPTMHPGIWLAFGSLGPGDYWRNKGRVEHVAFVDEPKADDDVVTFRVKQRYVADGQTVCEEVCRHTIRVREEGWWLRYDSEFRGGPKAVFGDQEEMGLGVRMTAKLCVKGGQGRIRNDAGDVNEAGVWGKPARWCDYGGLVDGRRLGAVVVPHPENPWTSRFHVRDYGLMVANPIGQKAFKVDFPEIRVIDPAEPLRLRFDVFVYDVLDGADLNLPEIIESQR